MSQLERVVPYYVEELEGEGTRADAMRRAVSRATLRGEPYLEALVTARLEQRRPELEQLTDDELRARAESVGLSWRGVLLDVLASHEVRTEVQIEILTAHEVR